LQNPIELIGEDRIQGVKLQKMKLEGAAGEQKALPVEPQ
jgi:hypothetical protein